MIRQPADTWSNLAYVAVGLWIWWAGRRTKDSRFATGYGALVALLGLASFFFHASLTWAGETLDVLGMYLVVGYLALHGLRLRGRLPGPFGPWLGALAAVSTATLVSDGGHSLRRPLFGGLALGLLVVELLPSPRPRDRRRLLGALALFLAAYGIWTLDQLKIVWSPESWLQGHAVWHLLCAASLGMLFVYHQEA